MPTTSDTFDARKWRATSAVLVIRHFSETALVVCSAPADGETLVLRTGNVGEPVADGGLLLEVQPAIVTAAMPTSDAIADDRR